MKPYLLLRVVLTAGTVRDASGGRMSVLAVLRDPAAEVMLLPVVCTLLGWTAGFVPGLCATCCTYLHKKTFTHVNFCA